MAVANRFIDVRASHHYEGRSLAYKKAGWLVCDAVQQEGAMVSRWLCELLRGCTVMLYCWCRTSATMFLLYLNVLLADIRLQIPIPTQEIVVIVAETEGVYVKPHVVRSRTSTVSIVCFYTALMLCVVAVPLLYPY